MSRPARIRRKDLKRPDEFLTVTTQVLAWATTHQRTLIGVGSALAVVIVAALAFFGVRHARLRDANADLARALVLYRDPAKGAEAANQLADVSRRWANTTAGDAAGLLAAAAELRADNVDSAVVELQEAAGRDWPMYLKQEALVAYAFALEKKGQPTEAIGKYAEASALGGPYTFDALLAEARLQESAGETQKARALYERVKRQFPDSPSKELVEAKLASP